MDLTDIYAIFYPTTKKCTLFSGDYGTFFKIDHILSHQASLNKNKKNHFLRLTISRHIWPTKIEARGYLGLNCRALHFLSRCRPLQPCFQPLLLWDLIFAQANLGHKSPALCFPLSLGWQTCITMPCLFLLRWGLTNIFAQAGLELSPCDLSLPGSLDSRCVPLCPAIKIGGSHKLFLLRLASNYDPPNLQSAN
jgi:hypothetical protein